MKIPSQKSSFAGDVLKMASAPLCTQILGIILMPIVTRLYTPEVYGVFTLFGSILMPICIFATMGYSGSIVLPQREEVASNMLCISIVSTVLITVLTIPLIWFGSELIFRLLKAPELGVYIWVLPISVFVYGLHLSLRSWNVRMKQFGRIAISRISFAVVNKGFLIGAGFSGFATAGSLIIGGIVGSMTMSGILGGRIWQESGQLFKRSIRWRTIVQGIKRYRKFPMYILWTDLVSRLASLMVVFLFSFYFSKSVVGYYGLGVAVLSIPATFIGSSIVDVFYQKVAAARREGERSSLVENLFKQMTWMSMLPFLVLAIIGDSLFAFVFGANWSDAGVYSQILSFQMFISFIMGPAIVLVNILEKQEFGLVIHIATTITSFISIMVGGFFDNIYLALSLFSLFSGLIIFGIGLLMLQFAGLPLSKVFSILFKCFVSCVPIIIVVALAKWCFGASSLLLIMISAIGSIIYYGKLLKEDKVLQSTIMMVFRKVQSVVNS